MFGWTNAFSIDTPYSARKPAEILPAELIEDRLQTNRRLLTIDEALSVALQNSREYQTAKETLYRSGLSLSDVRYQYKPIFDASGTLTRRTDEEVQATGSGRISFSQLLLSGGRLTATLASGLSRYYTGDPRRSVVNAISVDLAQPLLRGFGRNSPELDNLTQAERNVVYAVRNYADFQDRFALSVVNDYFRLLQQKETVRNSYTNYLRRVESTQRLEARAKDRESLSQVDQARQAELSSKNAYINAVASYQTQLDTFKITRLGLPAGEQLYLDDRALDELEEAGLIPTVLDSESAYRAAVQKKLPLVNEIDRFEDSKRRVRIAADQLRTGLNTFAGASYTFDQTEDYTRFDADKIKWSAGAELNLPFDRLRQRNSYRDRLISFESQLRGLTLTLDSLKKDIDLRLRTLEQKRANYEIQRNALELADRRVDSTTLLLQAGRVEVRDLNEALDAQIVAQNQVTAALVDYQEARLQLMLDIGALETELASFWLKDHLAGFLPGVQPSDRPPDTGEGPEPVRPPEEIFTK